MGALFNPDYDTCKSRDVIGRAMFRRMPDVLRMLVDRARAHDDYGAQMTRTPDIETSAHRLADACRRAYSTIEAWQFDQLDTSTKEDLDSLIIKLGNDFNAHKEVYHIACNILQVPRDLRAIIYAR